MLKDMFHGLCMAMADSVPGVSGGSIAFLLGFYDKFITSLNNIISRDRNKRMDALQFLGKLGIGWVLGMGIAVTVLSTIFSKNIYEISSLFLGFIVVAIFVMCREHHLLSKANFANILSMTIGFAVVIIITLLNQSTNVNIDLTNMTVPSAIYIFIAAMIAISAMVLPGISGSTLLLVFGLYLPVIAAIKSFLQFDLSVLPALVVFGLGVLTGIILFVRWIKMALEKFPVITMYAIIGLMIGSLYSIVMGPTTLEIPKEAMKIGTFSPLFFIIGAGLVLAMEVYKHYQETREKRMPERKIEAE